MNKALFNRQLRQFRVLTVVGYTLVLLILIGMPVVAARFEQSTLPFPAVVPVGIVGVVLTLCLSWLALLFGQLTTRQFVHIAGKGLRRVIGFGTGFDSMVRLDDIGNCSLVGHCDVHIVIRR